MKSLLSGCAACALVTISASGAWAADRVYQAHNAPMAVAGELSIWAQAVIPTGTLEDGDACDAGNDDFCRNALGFGGYAGVQVPVGQSLSLIADLTVDAHGQTDEDPTEDENPFYGGIGLHLVYDAGATQWGVFGMAAGGMNNGEDDAVGPVYGGGAEVRWENLFVQAGVVHYFPTDISGDDTIETLYFGRIGGELDLGPGMIEASLAVGAGDFDESRTDDDPGLWVQVAGEYEVPVTDYINLFVGYQGDYVRIDDGGADPNRTFLHTIKGGLTIPFGGEGLEFKTPNLRAPLTSAGEMN